MKTYLKKVSALFIAFVMMLAMCVPAFAAITGATIKVTNLGTTGTKTVNLYEIYELDENDNMWTLSVWVKESGIIEKESDLSDPNKIAALEAYVKENGTDANYTSGVLADDITEYLFNDANIQVGAYLVLVTGDDKTTYSPMVATTCKYNETTGLIEKKDAVVVAKADSYHVDKSDNVNNGSVEVGDLITYTIETTVPFLEEGSQAKFTIQDTLTGATYYLTGDAIKDVEPVNIITIGDGDKEIEENIPEIFNGMTQFGLDLSKYATDKNEYAGQKVVITYTAKVDAVDEVTNTATSSHDSTGDKTVSKTGNIKLTKYAYDETKEDKQGVVLAGAEFIVSKDGENDEKLYAELAKKDGKVYVTGNWVAYTDAKDVSAEHRVTTGADGIVQVYGLREGTYNFVEVIAPDGYTVDGTEKPVTITSEKADGVVTITNGETTMTNTKLSELPSTGGIGTYIFTIVGVVMMAAAAGMLFMKRRGEAE